MRRTVAWIVVAVLASGAACTCGGPIIVPPDAPGDVVPVLLVFHGGGGNPDNMRKLTCPDGDERSDRCLDVLAAARGYAVVFPAGTSNPFAPNVRTFNAGGGEGNYICVSGIGCEQGTDHVSEVRALLESLETDVAGTAGAPVFATGISNGAAMAYRVACEMSDVVRAIAPVAGGNQLAAVQGCAPANDVALLHVHGTADPSWPFLGGVPENDIEDGKEMVAVVGERGDATVPAWAAARGCGVAPTIERSEDARTPFERQVFSDCRVPVELLQIEGAGHTWPQGWQYFAEDRIGATAQNVDANTAMLDFFDEVAGR